MKKRVTIYQIAAESGVSVSTVSRVLNNSPSVSEDKYNRIKAVIDKYNFTPNTLARGLTNKQTMTLGVIIPDISNPYFASLFLQIERYALEHNYTILLSNTLYGGSSHGVETPFSEHQYFQIMIDKQVDGVLIVGGQIDKEDISKEYIASVNELNKIIPVVIMGQKIDDCDCLFIQRNMGGGIVSAVHHLHALGNDRIGFVGGEVGVRITSARLEAYRNTLKSLSLPYDETLVALSDYYTKDGYTAMDTLLKHASPKPTAVIAMNDMVAIGAMRAITDHGLRIPEDIAIVSCDQFFDSDYLIPRLTALDQQNEYLGRLSIMQLVSAINGMKETIQISHVPELIIRESCGAKLGKRKRNADPYSSNKI